MTEINIPITQYPDWTESTFNRGIVFIPQYDFRIIAVSLPKDLVTVKGHPTQVEIYQGGTLIATAPIYGNIVFFDNRPQLYADNYYSIVCSGATIAKSSPKLNMDLKLFKVLYGAQNPPDYHPERIFNIESIEVETDMTLEELKAIGVQIPEPEDHISTDYVNTGFLSGQLTNEYGEVYGGAQPPVKCVYNGINVWAQWDTSNTVFPNVSIYNGYQSPWLGILNGKSLGTKLQLTSIPPLGCSFESSPYPSNIFFSKEEIYLHAQQSYAPNTAREYQPGARNGNAVLEIQANIVSLNKISFNVETSKTIHDYFNPDIDYEESASVYLNFTTGTNILLGESSIRINKEDYVEIHNLGDYKFDVIINGESNFYDFSEALQLSVYKKIFPFFIIPVMPIKGEMYDDITLSWIKIRNMTYEELTSPPQEELAIPSYYPPFAQICKSGEFNYVGFSEDIRNTKLICGDNGKVKFYMGTTFTIREFGWGGEDYIVPDKDYQGILELHNIDFNTVAEVTIECSAYGVETGIIERDLFEIYEDINKKFLIGFTDGEKVKLASNEIMGKNETLNIKKVEGGLMINEVLFDTAYFNHDLPLRLFFQGVLNQFDVYPMIAYSIPPQENYSDINLDISLIDIVYDYGIVQPPSGDVEQPETSIPSTASKTILAGVAIAGVVGAAAYIIQKRKKQK